MKQQSKIEEKEALDFWRELKEKGWKGEYNINAVWKGGTPFIFCIVKNIKNYSFLINSGCDINQSGDNHYSPIMVAINYNRDSIIEDLLSRDVDLSFVGNHPDNPTALSLALEGSVKWSVPLLEKMKTTLSQKKLDEFLFDSVVKKDLDAVNWLIKNGANVNFQNEKETMDTPLIKALAGELSGSNQKIIQALLESGADTSILNNEGEKAIHIIFYDFSFLNFKWKLDTLIHYGADINAKNKDGFTPLMNSVYEGDEYLHIILEKNPDPFLKNNKGQTAWDIAKSESENNNIASKIYEYMSRVEKENLQTKLDAPLTIDNKKLRI